MSYPETLSRLEDQIRQLEDVRMEEARERDRLRSDINRLRNVIKGISEYCSGEDQTLSAIKRLAAIRNTADQALLAH